MTGNVIVQPGPGQNTHHVSFSDSVDIWGGILELRPDKTLDFLETPQTPSTLDFAKSGGKYGDFGPGMSHLEQSDWSGGRGAEFFADDATRYYDEQSCWTLTPKRLLPGPQWKIATGPTGVPMDLPGDMYWRKLISTDRFLAVSIVPGTTYTFLTTYLWIRRRGYPGTLTMEMRTNSAGAPTNTVLKSATVDPTTITDFISVFYSFAYASGQSLTSGTTYWIVIYGASTDNQQNHWEVGTHSGNTGAKSTGGAGSWTATTYPPYYLVNTTTKAEVLDRDYVVFELEGALYFVDRHLPDTTTGSGSSALFMQGDRGNAGDNTADKTKLNQSNKTLTWTSNQWAGAKIKIIAGPGQGEWRTIASNSATVITVSSAFNVIQTTASRYVIYDVNSWSAVSGLPANFTVTDACVVDNICYFACGSNIIRQFRNNSTSGANEFNTTETQAGISLMKLFYSPDQGKQLWVASQLGAYVNHATLEGGDELLNGVFDADTNWTKGAGWTIAAGLATAAASSADLSQTVAPLTAGYYYEVAYTISGRTAGTVTPVVGGTTGTARSRNGTYTEILLASTTAFKFTPTGFTGNLDNVTCVQKLAIWGGILVFGKAVAVGDASKLITNLMPYDDEMWALKEDSLWRIVNDRPAKLDVGLDSMSALSNGLAACTSGLYMYFSWSFSLEQLYGATLTDIGPWRDQGLPSGRQGPISALIPVVGWLIAAIDGGPSGTSSVLIYDGKGWHEVFRGWETGRRIRSLKWVPVKGGQPKLYVGYGSLLVYLTFPQDTLHPQKDAAMPYVHEAVIESATFDMDRARLPKFIKEVEIAADNLRITSGRSEVGKEVYLDYAFDDDIGTGQWVPAAEFMESPQDSQQVNIGAVRAVRFRLRLCTDQATVPVVVRAFVAEMYGRTPVKYQYHLKLKLGTFLPNLQGGQDADPDLFVDWLKLAAASARKIRVRSVFRQWDDKLIIIEPPTVQRQFQVTAGIEGWGGTVSLVCRDV